jgi:nucleoside-triphosphatase
MNNTKVIIITGNKGDGKTTMLLKIVDVLNNYNTNVAGFVAVGEWRNGERSKYTLVDILSGKSAIICTDTAINGYDKHGRFYFNPLAIKFGEKILSNTQKQNWVIVIDEIGPFELEGKVWHKLLLHHIEKTQNLLLLSVRESLVDEIVEKYKLTNVIIYNTKANVSAIVKEIRQNVI